MIVFAEPFLDSIPLYVLMTQIIFHKLRHGCIDHGESKGNEESVGRQQVNP